MNLISTEAKVGFALALAGLGCGVVAALLQGGAVAGFAAASAGFTGLAGVWGYATKPPAK